MSKTKWVRLGDYIDLVDRRNTGSKLTSDDVRGISVDKQFIDTKANLEGISLSSYKVVNQDEFVYVADTSRRGDKIALALNEEEYPRLVSSVYTVFRTHEELLSKYLYLLLSRGEFDRYARFHSWGSARETFDWSDLCRVSIPLPSLEVQQELVDTYDGLQSLAEDNDALASQLSEISRALVVECRRKYDTVDIGKYIDVIDLKNVTDVEYPFCGVNKDKDFMPTVANTNDLDKRKYKVVRKETFVFSGMQTGRDMCIRLALYGQEDPILVSPAYTTFRVSDGSPLLPEYLFLQFNRPEMDRLGWFLSDGSIRSNLEWDRFCDIRIPLPPIEVQQSIANIYNCMDEARRIAAEARAQLDDLVPALVQRAIHS